MRLFGKFISCRNPLEINFSGNLINHIMPYHYFLPHKRYSVIIFTIRFLRYEHKKHIFIDAHLDILMDSM